MNESHSLVVTAPGDADRVLLHTCCAPCSSAIIECLLHSGIRPTIYYCNPNIFPEEEYLIRKRECTRYALSLGLEIVDADYDHDAWLSGIRTLAAGSRVTDIEHQPERGGRCLQCFKYRLLDSARYAAEHGFSVLTTTLASSRWKSLDQINEAGRWAVAQVNAQTGSAVPPTVDLMRIQTRPESLSNAAPLIWWEQNWRKGGLQERRSQLIREHNFYKQLWCGCEFSRR